MHRYLPLLIIKVGTRARVYHRSVQEIYLGDINRIANSDLARLHFMHSAMRACVFQVVVKLHSYLA